MKKLLIGSLVAVALIGITASAQASTAGQFYVSWTGTSSFSWKFDGALQSDVNNGIATGGFQAGGSGPVTDLGLVWCVDLFNFTGTNDDYVVTNYTEADAGDEFTGGSSLYNWINPSGDGDDLRSVAGLGQAAWLANYWGSQADAWTAQKKRALQMAIWQAAYGSRFEYVTGGDIDATAYAGFLADIAAGKTDANHSWYDNNQDGNYYQDFIDDVPEPGSLLLLGGLLLGTGAAAWRKRKQA